MNDCNRKTAKATVLAVRSVRRLERARFRQPIRSVAPYGIDPGMRLSERMVMLFVTFVGFNFAVMKYDESGGVLHNQWIMR